MGFYQPDGGEFTVNTVTAGFQGSPDSVGLTGGGFVESWGSETNNVVTGHLQVFAADGSRIGGERTIAVGGFVALPNGGFIGTGSVNERPVAQMYGATGQAAGGQISVGTPFPVPTFYSGSDVTVLQSGGFVVTWVERFFSGFQPSFGVLAQVFDAAGQPVAAPLFVSTFSQTFGKEAQVITLANGNFMIFVNSGETGLIAQIFDPAGTRIGSPFPIENDDHERPTEPQATPLADGGFVLTWAENRSGGGFVGIGDLRAQLFDNAGAKVGAEISIDPDGPTQVASTDTIALPNGGFVVTWAADGHETGPEPLRTGVVAQAFDATGARVGDTFLVNTHVTGYQASASIAGLTSGAFVVSWADFDFSGTGFSGDIKAQLYQAPITGSNEGETLTGTSGGDLILALGGDDVVAGLAGDDRLEGGAGADTASYAAATAGVTVSLAAAGPQNTRGAGIDTLIEFEAIVGSAFDDVLTGNRGANLLLGGAGNDVLNGGVGIDTASYADAVAGVTVRLATSVRQMTGGAGADRLIAIENVVGSAFDDMLSGSAGANVLEGGAGIDTVDYARAGGGVHVNLAITGRQGTGGDGVDTLAGFEIINGSRFDDQLAGDAGHNVLTGNAGDDLLRGDLGNDVLSGGAGSDTISYAGLAAGVTVDLRLTSAQDTHGAGIDTLSSIESLVGTAQGDMLTGSVHANRIVGGAGDDVIDAGGGSASDTLDGGTGNDVLNGGAGADILTGGAGRDVLAGGGGGDRFVYQAATDSRPGGSADRILDFAAGDVLDLSAIDANASTTGTNDAFARVASFSGVAGQFTLAFAAATNITTLLADTDGNGAADFSILFTGDVTALTGTWVL